MFNASYTYADQKSTGIDGGNSSLGGVPYDPFNPETDYTQDAWVSRHRFVLYGIYDLPVGRGKKLGSGMSGWADAVIGGWQSTFQMQRILVAVDFSEGYTPARGLRESFSTDHRCAKARACKLERN